MEGDVINLGGMTLEVVELPGHPAGSIGLYCREELAEKLNVTRQTVSGWETGRRQPDLDTLKELADSGIAVAEYAGSG